MPDTPKPEHEPSHSTFPVTFPVVFPPRDRREQVEAERAARESTDGVR